MITLQYLEYSPDLISYTKEQILTRLRSAYQRLPFSHLLMGWHVPPPLLEACRADADRLGVRFLRWQPLLTTDRVGSPSPSPDSVNYLACFCEPCFHKAAQSDIDLDEIRPEIPRSTRNVRQ